MLDETVGESEPIQDGLKDLEAFTFQPGWARADSSGVGISKKRDSDGNFKRNHRGGGSHYSDKSFSGFIIYTKFKFINIIKIFELMIFFK